MKKFLFLLLFLPLVALAQDPTCKQNFSFSNGTGLVSSTPIDNRQLGCDTWVMQYTDTNVSPINMTVEQAFVTNTCTGASYVTFTGTVTAGTNPATSTTGAETRLQGYVSCLRVTISGTPSGTWLVTGTLYGFRAGYINGASSSGSSCPNPCPVIGPTAAGSPPANPPVLAAGIDGTNIRTIKTDTNGSPIPANASFVGADGNSNTELSPSGASAAQLFFRTLPQVYNGSTTDRQFACTNQAQITITAGTDTVLVAGVALTNIRVCHLDFSSDTSVSFTIRQGTGSTCGTGTTALAGAYPNTVAFAMDYSPLAALRTTTTANDLCLHASASATVGGVIIYAQF